MADIMTIAWVFLVALTFLVAMILIGWLSRVSRRLSALRGSMLEPEIKHRMIQGLDQMTILNCRLKSCEDKADEGQNRLAEHHTQVNEIAARLRTIEETVTRNVAGLAEANEANRNLKDLEDKIQDLRKIQIVTEKAHGLILAAFAETRAGMPPREVLETAAETTEPQDLSLMPKEGTGDYVSPGKVPLFRIPDPSPDVVQLTDDNEQVQNQSKRLEDLFEKKTPEPTNANERLTENVTKLTDDNEWRQSESDQLGESIEKKAVELSNATEQLTQNIAPLEAGNEQLQNEAADHAETGTNGMEGSDEKGPSRIKDVAHEVPWITREKGRGRLLKGLANLGSRLRRARDREEVTQVEDII
jgi:DNA repair exonuclease SbcCD ATPase subunit